jgi:hypothetical protein
MALSLGRGEGKEALVGGTQGSPAGSVLWQSVVGPSLGLRRGRAVEGAGVDCQLFRGTSQCNTGLR